MRQPGADESAERGRPGEAELPESTAPESLVGGSGAPGSGPQAPPAPRIVVIAAARLLAFGAARLLEEGGVPAVGTLRSPQGLARARRRLRLEAVVAVATDGGDDLLAVLADPRLGGLRRVVLVPPTSLAIRGGDHGDVLLLPLTVTAERLRRAVTAPRPALRRMQVVVGDDGSLTVRQQQVLTLVAEGLSNQEVADRLDVGLETVKTHLRTVYRKLGVRSRAEAITRYMEVSAA